MLESAHVDTFAADRLPAPHLMPELRFDLPELQYPARLNASVRFLDRHVGEGRGVRRCIVSPQATWSYDDLAGQANRIARVLVEDLGVLPGHRVLLRATNCAMLVACWFAVLKAGAIAVTTMPLYRAGELRRIAHKAQIHHMLVEASLEAEVLAACDDLPGVAVLTFGDERPDDLSARMRTKASTFTNVDTAAEDIALITFTSGTTGQPKAAMQTHRDLLATCDTFGRHVLRAGPDDLFCGSPPLGFTFGLGGLLLFPLDLGAATLLLAKAGPQELLHAVQTHRASVLFTAPIAYRAMTTLCAQFDISSLRTCVSAGETLSKSVWEGWHAATGLRIIDGIGSTEMLHIFIASPSEQTRPGSTGRVVPGYIAQIHDEEGNPSPVGQIGRLAVKGPTGCRYLDDVRQADYVQHGWNYPGDAYRMDADGYFFYVARTDDMIVSAGYNISGPEVEEALLTHPDVLECAVIAKPDPAHDTHIVKAYVVLAGGCAPSPEMGVTLREYARSCIASFKAPREIEFVAELPRTLTGKVQRFRLREQAAQERSSPAP
ncbi:MAG: AMP-binding protein [Vulcanimicrobiaceae bacterium]